MTLHVSNRVEGRLKTLAEQVGLDPAAFVEKLIAEYQPEGPQTSHQDPTLSLFAQWRKEDSQMTNDEVEQEAQLWREFEKGINETRQSLGMERL